MTSAENFAFPAAVRFCKGACESGVDHGSRAATLQNEQIVRAHVSLEAYTEPLTGCCEAIWTVLKRDRSVHEVIDYHRSYLGCQSILTICTLSGKRAQIAQVNQYCCTSGAAEPHLIDRRNCRVRLRRPEPCPRASRNVWRHGPG